MKTYKYNIAEIAVTAILILGIAAIASAQTNAFRMAYKSIPIAFGTNKIEGVSTNYEFMLRAAISNEVVLKWETTSVEYPRRTEYKNSDGTPAMYQDAVYIATGYHQIGTYYSNTTAYVRWKGGTVACLLESVEVGKTNRVEWK